MKPTKTLFATIAFACACLRAPAAAAGTLEGVPPADGARVGFFSIPARPIAYSFADICNLTIEPNPASVYGTPSGGFAVAPDLASIWTADGRAWAIDAAAPRAAAATPIGSRHPFSLASLPDPADWMRLCGFALVVLIAKRRRDWLAMRGIALANSLPLRRRGRAPFQVVVRTD